MSDTIDLPSRYWRIAGGPAEPAGHVDETLHLRLERTALVIVDAYGAGFDDGEVPPELTGIYEPDPIMRDIVVNLLPQVKRAAKKRGIPVLYLTNALRQGLSEDNTWRRLSIRTTGVDVLEAWRAPTPILEFSQVIAPDDDDVLIEKQLYSGFFETGLDSALRNRDVRTLIMVGFDSRVCLGTTATEAMYRNYNVIVLRDCTRTFEFPETAEGEWANFMAIRYLESQVGYTSTSNAFIKAVAGD